MNQDLFLPVIVLSVLFGMFAGLGMAFLFTFNGPDTEICRQALYGLLGISI